MNICTDQLIAWQEASGDCDVFGIKAEGGAFLGARITNATTIKVGENIMATESIQASRQIVAYGQIIAGKNLLAECISSTEGGIRTRNTLRRSNVVVYQ